MTRRQFLLAAGTAAAGADKLVVPVRLILDAQVKWKPYEAEWFRSRLWAEAVRDLTACGIRLQTAQGTGEVARPPFRAMPQTQGGLPCLVSRSLPFRSSNSETRATAMLLAHYREVVTPTMANSYWTIRGQART